MIHFLKLNQVGPTRQLAIPFKPRLNFLTGDNGIGKTFLLDITWWALTRTWAHMPILPSRGARSEPSIHYSYEAADGKPYEFTSKFVQSDLEWSGKRGRPPVPGLVIYAQVDGGFSVWDPARNYWNDRIKPAFLFQPEDLWHGLVDKHDPNDKKIICNGLIADWANWQRENGDSFRQLVKVLEQLSPSDQMPLRPANLARISPHDVRDHPHLVMPYGQDVALVHAAAGIRRMVTLAYVLVWSWREHVQASVLRGTPPTSRIIFLIDEIEAHLHPQWQRRLIPALLDVMQSLTSEKNLQVQWLIATHAPLVLASAETRFVPDQDAIWTLQLDPDGQVTLDTADLTRRGDVNRWLCSVFGLAQPRSWEAEQILAKAMGLLRTSPRPPVEAFRQVDEQLQQVLGETDPFWTRWSAFMMQLEDHRT